MIDEGYIKFECVWTEDTAIPDEEIADLIEWRNRLCRAGLIGHDAALDVGFGNISRREPGARGFVISATRTGHVPVATGHEFTRVVDYDIAANRVVCRGPRQASSESLTHAAIYELDSAYLAVAHAHSRDLWRSLAGEVPTTDAGIAYGTAEMAGEFLRLYRDDDLREARIAVMGGHEEGLISIGTTVKEAAERLLSLCS